MSDARREREEAVEHPDQLVEGELYDVTTDRGERFRGAFDGMESSRGRGLSLVFMVRGLRGSLPWGRVAEARPVAPRGGAR